MKFKLQYQSFKNNVLECILLTGGFVSMNEIVELIKPFMYDNKVIKYLNCKTGEFTTVDKENNQDEVHLSVMDTDNLVSFADHLTNPKNFKIIKIHDTLT